MKNTLLFCIIIFCLSCQSKMDNSNQRREHNNDSLAHIDTITESSQTSDVNKAKDLKNEESMKSNMSSKFDCVDGFWPYIIRLSPNDSNAFIYFDTLNLSVDQSMDCEEYYNEQRSSFSAIDLKIHSIAWSIEELRKIAHGTGCGNDMTIFTIIHARPTEDSPYFELYFRRFRCDRIGAVIPIYGCRIHKDNYEIDIYEHLDAIYIPIEEWRQKNKDSH